MKILHTSDWHLGHTLYNYDRSEEQLAMLTQIKEIARRQQPDVLLLCGDVFHTSQPSAAVQTMLADALAAIHQVCPDTTMVVTAGNHDSGSKHEIFRTPWQALNVHVIGCIDKEEEATDRHLIEVPGKGFIVAVPYVHERNLPEGFFQHLLNRVNERNTAQLPVVMMAHTTVKGCDYAGHERATELTVGGIDSLDLSEMGSGYDYLALGHIHRAQFVGGSHHRTRYCGTPLAVSFDEHYPHSVSLVEIAQHGEMPQVETVEIENPHPLVTLPTEGFANWERAKTLLADFPDDIPAYVRLNVEVDDFLPTEANAEALLLTEGKLCHFCQINVRRKQQSESGHTTVLTVAELQAEEPVDILRRYAEDLGIPFDEELASLFREAEEMVHADTRNQ